MSVSYTEDKSVAYFDGYKFHRDNQTGYYLSSKKMPFGRRERLHCYVWEYYNGKIPTGYHIHHKDEDKYNNEIENLVCLPKREHESLHGKENAEKNHDELAKKLAKARDKAAEWHGSDEGRQWHKEQWKQSIGKIKPKALVCQYCGSTYYSKKPDSKYCNNNCRAAARRKSGIDNEARVCAYCGKEFVCNKYSAQKCCSSDCAVAFRWMNYKSA